MLNKSQQNKKHLDFEMMLELKMRPPRTSLAENKKKYRAVDALNATHLAEHVDLVIPLYDCVARRLSSRWSSAWRRARGLYFAVALYTHIRTCLWIRRRRACSKRKVRDERDGVSSTCGACTVTRSAGGGQVSSGSPCRKRDCTKDDKGNLEVALYLETMPGATMPGAERGGHTRRTSESSACGAFPA